MDTQSTIPAACRSQAHAFIGDCGREDIPPHDLERVLERRGAQIEPYPSQTAGWTFPDGSVVRVWNTGRSLLRPLVHLETRDGAELVQRWWIWWKARWSRFERALETVPTIEFQPSSPPDRQDDTDADAYRILVDGHRVGELVWDIEVRRWFLEAGSLLPPGCGCWLDFAMPRAQTGARYMLAQALLWQHSEFPGALAF